MHPKHLTVQKLDDVASLVNNPSPCLLYCSQPKKKFAAQKFASKPVLRGCTISHVCLDISHVFPRPGHFPCLPQTRTFAMSAKDLDICHVFYRPGHLPCLLKTWTSPMSAAAQYCFISPLLGEDLAESLGCKSILCAVYSTARTVHWSIVQCSAVQCSAVQCSAVQCSAVQCSAVQCSAVKLSALHCCAGGPR